MVCAEQVSSRARGDAARAVEAHLGLVRHIAGRVLRSLPPRYEADEVVQWGVCGLLHAARSFDASQGVAFSTFAYRRIHGAILDEVRRSDPSRRLERRSRRRVAQAARARREPDAAPAKTEPPPRAPISCISLEALQAEQRRPLASAADDAPEVQAVRAERAARLIEAVRRLPLRERRIIQLHYFEGVRIKSIAEAMAVTGGRVSQLHTRALHRLAALLAR